MAGGKGSPAKRPQPVAAASPAPPTPPAAASPATPPAAASPAPASPAPPAPTGSPARPGGSASPWAALSRVRGQPARQISAARRARQRRGVPLAPRLVLSLGPALFPAALGPGRLAHRPGGGPLARTGPGPHRPPHPPPG